MEENTVQTRETREPEENQKPQETREPEQNQRPKAGARTIIYRVITGLILAFAVFMMVFTIVSVTTFDRTDRSLFGYKAFIVLSDSMKATDFAAGDLIFVKETDPATLEAGDIICFQSTNKDSYGEIITHKIRALTKDAEGNPGFITYGTTTDTDDEAIVLYTFVIGKYEGKIPGLGHFFQFLKTTPGYLVCIFLPFMLLIVWQGVGAVRLFLQYKREQRAEIQAEKQKLEEERLEAQRMMEELRTLRKQMAGQSSDGRQSEAPMPEDEVSKTQEGPAAQETLTAKEELLGEPEGQADPPEPKPSDAR